VLAMTKQGDAIHCVQEAFRHCKTLGAIGEGVRLWLQRTFLESTSRTNEQR
jgi:hypothetical protein